jgi:hypothetical protein
MDFLAAWRAPEAIFWWPRASSRSSRTLRAEFNEKLHFEGISGKSEMWLKCSKYGGERNFKKNLQKIACCVHTSIYYVLARKRGSRVLRLTSQRDPKAKKNGVTWKKVCTIVFRRALGGQRDQKLRGQCAETTINIVVFVRFSFSPKPRVKEISIGFWRSSGRFWDLI